MPKQEYPHDIYLTIASTKYGFMLGTDKNGRKLWDVYDTPVMSVMANQAGYGAYPPEEEIVVSQSDWRGGMGHDFYDGKPVYKGESISSSGIVSRNGVDARWKSKLMLPPEHGPTYINPGLNALDGAAVRFVEFTDQLWIGAGSYVYQHVVADSDWSSGTDLTTDLTDLITHGAYMFAALGGSNNFKQSTDGTTWVTTTGADFKADYFATVGTRIYKAIKPNEVKWATHGEEIFAPATPAGSATAGAGLSTGNYRYKYSYWVDSGYEAPVSAASANIATSGDNHQITLTSIPVSSSPRVNYKNVYRTAVGGSTYYRVALIANSVTSYVDSMSDATLVAAGYVYPTGNTLQSTWSKAMLVGDKETDITGMIELLGELYVGKEEGLYKVTADNKVIPITTAFRYMRSTTNFTKMAVFQNELFFKIGNAGLYVYDGNTIRDVGFTLYAPNIDYRSNISTLIPGIDFLYVPTDNLTGGVPNLLTLRKEEVNGVIDYRWHLLKRLIACAAPTCGIISTVNYTNPRLWLGTTAPNYITLNLVNLTPDKDSGYVFETDTCGFYTSQYDMGFPLDDKIFLSVDIQYTLPAGNTIAVYYVLDGNNVAWTKVGSDITSGTSATRYINAKGRFIQLGLLLDTDASSETPVIHGIAIRAVLRPIKRKIFDFAVRVADDIITRTGATEKIPSSALATQLKNADDPATQTGVVTLQDLDGTSHSVVFKSLREVEVFDEVNRRPERYFYIKAVKVVVA